MIRGAKVWLIATAVGTSASLSGATKFETVALPSSCVPFSGWRGRADDVDQRQYINTTDGRTLLEFQGPGDEDQNGPVAPGSAIFGGSFKGLKVGKRYRLHTSISVERSDNPYVLSFSGLRASRADYRVSVPSTKSADIDVIVTAQSPTAALFWQTKGHNKMWAFVAATSMCPEPEPARR